MLGIFPSIQLLRPHQKTLFRAVRLCTKKKKWMAICMSIFRVDRHKDGCQKKVFYFSIPIIADENVAQSLAWKHLKMKTLLYYTTCCHREECRGDNQTDLTRPLSNIIKQQMQTILVTKMLYRRVCWKPCMCNMSLRTKTQDYWLALTTSSCDGGPIYTWFLRNPTITK